MNRFNLSIRVDAAADVGRVAASQPLYDNERRERDTASGWYMTVQSCIGEPP